jgi:uncharacterized membrane protein YcaP (DUF421 family)
MRLRQREGALEDVILASLELNGGVLVLFLFMHSTVDKQAIS